MLKTIYAIFVFSLLSCSSNQPKPDNVLKEIDSTSGLYPKPLIIESEDESWGGDIRLSFTESSTSDKGTTYLVNSIYENKNIGFKITVAQDGPSKLIIKSSGRNSDHFIHLLQKLYKQKLDTTTNFIDSLVVDCLPLAFLNKNGEKNAVLAAERKLFFQGANEDDYAELFLNINNAEHWIELKEKDQDYRAILIKLMTQK